MKPRTVSSIAIATLLLLATQPARAQKTDSAAAVKAEVVKTYASIAAHCYTDAHTQAVALQKALSTFTSKPSTGTLSKAKQAWVAARLPYLQSEVFRFSGGPIDDGDGPEAMLNGWPLDEAYIDYVKDNPKAGLINNPEKYPTIDKKLIASLNEKGGERNISCGFHAIEFLLWGQDLSADGPGKRPFEDYVTAKSASAPRRAQYLNACADLLVEQLAGLVAEWKPGVAETARSKFLALPVDEAMRKILTGVGTLSGRELAGERIGVAYKSREQEEETSCFSDTSHFDLIYNCAGIANIFAGAYVGIDSKVKVQGAGLIKLATALGEKKGTDLKLAINEVMFAATGLRPPFDKALLAPDKSPARESIKQLMDSLNELASSTAGLAKDLGIKINIAEE